YSPDLLATCVQDEFVAMLPESNACDAAVTVCGNRSLFTHTIRSPRRTRNSGGLYCMFSMTTVCATPVAGRCASAATMSDEPNSATRHGQSSHERIISLGTALAQLRLQLLRHIEVRHECRPHLDQQCLELSVLSARDQSLVQRAQYRLMVGDFVID